MIKGLLFSGTANSNFSQNVAKNLKTTLASCDINKFANGEIQININQSVRKQDCYVIQTTSKSLDNFQMIIYLNYLFSLML